MSVFKVGGDGLLSKGNIIAQSNVVVFGDVRVAEGSNVYIGNNAVVTELELGTSLSALRAALEAPVANVLYVATNGDDNNTGYALSNALANIHTALERAEPWTTIFVKSGEYVLYNNPVTIPRRVGLVGDNLRTTTIRPQNNTSDMFYLNNGCYVTQITFRDHLSPAAVFSYNPDGSAGAISTSPYIQNCSSITTTGTGMRVDGNYVTGLRSMVCDAYTQTNSGGVGIHMLNRGYTQLVSVFTICCDIAILCESGGFCSVTNSNSSFGNYGLKADGISEPTNSGKYVSSQDTDDGQTFTFANLTVKPNYGDAVLFSNIAFTEANITDYLNGTWANISNVTADFYTVATSSNLENNVATVTFLEFIDTGTLTPDAIISFHQPSYISSSGHTFEYVGSGTNLATALPYAGGVPIQTNEIVQSGGGRVYFTSTDQQGDFRIGTELVINRVDGTIQGRTFNKALFAVMTPYLLAIEG